MVFSSEDNAATSLDFTISASAKWYLKPFAGLLLRHQQKIYMEDFEKKHWKNSGLYTKEPAAVRRIAQNPPKTSYH